MLKETEGNPAYHVGDVVQVVDRPYSECSFAWTRGMDGYCGHITTIKIAYWSRAYETYAYTIADTDDYVFCKDCFVPIEEDDFDYDPVITTSLILESVVSI